MPRPSLNNIRGLGDFQSLYRWDVQFASIPASVSGAPTIDDLNFRCESTSVPTAENEKITINIRGQKIYNPGIMTYNNQMTLNFAETVDNKVHLLLKGWRDACWNFNTGVQSAPAEDLKGNIILYRLDNQDGQVWKYDVRGVWLESYTLPDMDVSSDVFKPSLVFSYDSFLDEAV